VPDDRTHVDARVVWTVVDGGSASGHDPGEHEDADQREPTQDESPPPHGEIVKVTSVDGPSTPPFPAQVSAAPKFTSTLQGVTTRLWAPSCALSAGYGPPGFR
jgi:hypothetical protein